MLIYNSGIELDTDFIDQVKLKAAGARNSIDIAKWEEFSRIAYYYLQRIVDAVNEFGPKVTSFAEINGRLQDPDIATFTKVKTKLTANQLTYILDFCENHIQIDVVI